MPLEAAVDVQSIALQIVGSIYDAAADPQLWPRVLDQLGAALRSHVNVFTLEDESVHRNNLSIGIGLDPTFQSLYDEHLASVNIHIKRARPLLQVAVSSRAMKFVPTRKC